MPTRREIQNKTVKELRLKLGLTAAELAFAINGNREKIMEIDHLKLKDVPEPIKSKLLPLLEDVKAS
ncbi:MAG: transcriptional regulator [Firmicutes bacterium]|nr:transcriptional regulator [Bacillota bacterium]